jgi:hypothetical protein
VSGPDSPSASSSLYPTTALIGVLISCDIIARKSLFALLAELATSSAAAAMRLRSSSASLARLSSSLLSSSSSASA